VIICLPSRYVDAAALVAAGSGVTVATHPNFKILYDIYHMQISEGDIINTIAKHHDYFGHYHTAGVPGRHEIDESQELYYPAIMKAIVATGYKGYVAQEFIPTASDKLGALKKAVTICDV
jgi:hydroxypyruvate isomerase